MAYKPPEVQLKSVIDFGQALTVMQSLAQAGMMDMGAFAEFGAKQLNIPAIKQIFKPLFVDAAQGARDPHQATKPAATQRETVRNNVSRGASGSGQTAMLGQLMQSGAGGGGTATVTRGGR